jgi:L-aspartate oxidase
MTNRYDFLVIGSGIAGLNFAIEAAKHGKVAIVTKKELMESNSNYAQGGIAAVLDKYDSFDKHIKDTLKAGCDLNNKKAVEIMIKQAPKAIKRLIKLGVGFSKTKEDLSLTKEGGHSARRIAHAHDATGKEIERALIHQVRHNDNISIFESHLAFELITNDNQCHGALVLDTEDNKILTFNSKATILATGGSGQVYLRNSNPKIATGDGIAMAYEAGAEIQDMEFFQFHPTALDKKNKPAFLISEALRGESAILRNSKKQKFMNKYHKLADLAPRDIVARAIYNESKDGQVYLDIRHKGAKYIKERFPYIYDQLWWYDIKMDKDLIPVSPAAHFLCGGVHTDLQGRTNIPGLFAFGEVAHTGVHGANRLASNSLLECMVFSSRAVNSAKNYVRKLQVTSYKLQKIPKTNKPKTNTYKKEIQKKMWENVGIIREPKKLESTFEKLVRIERKIHDVYNKGINREIIELKNLCITAILITKAALEREKSVGTHYIK